MLRHPEKTFEKHRSRKMYGNDFIPEIPLSPYSEQQFRAIRHADSGILNISL